MSDEFLKVPRQARWLLDAHVHTFEHLESLLLLCRQPRRDFTATEVADALHSTADLSGVLEQLVEARLLERREHQSMATYGYRAATIELAASLQCLLSAYEHNRSAVIRQMNVNAIARLRSGAARLFADSFVVRRESRPSAPFVDRRHPVALFLAVDGTLVDFAPRPEAVMVPPRIVRLLTRVHVALAGALALVSGRSVRQLDCMFAPLKLPCAGMHGWERRDCSGQLHYAAADAARLEPVRIALGSFVARRRGLLLEDKGASLALHYRERPELAGEVDQRMSEALGGLGAGFRLQTGVLVHELLPEAASKGRAVEAFLGEPAFAGRVPIFIGDDLTDLDGFAEVERHGGRGIAVGHLIRSQSTLPQPWALIDWLEFLVRAGGRYAM